MPSTAPRSVRRPRAAAASVGILACVALAGLPACTPPKKLTETEIAGDALVSEARRAVTVIGLEIPEKTSVVTGTTRRVSFQGTSAVRLPDGSLLTARHSVPEAAEGTMLAERDTRTGELRAVGRGPGPRIVVALDGEVRFGRVAELGDAANVWPAPLEPGARDDWALIEMDNPDRWPDAAARTATPRVGEACFMIGHPVAYLPADGLTLGEGRSNPDRLAWTRTPAVVIPGTIASVGADRITVRTAGVAGSRAKGLSGGGVFVRRDGGPALVGVAVIARGGQPIIEASPLTPAVRRRIDRR